MADLSLERSLKKTGAKSEGFYLKGKTGEAYKL